MSFIGDITETDIQKALTPIQSIVFAVREKITSFLIEKIWEKVEAKRKLESFNGKIEKSL
jgi:hypothetical protein